MRKNLLFKSLLALALVLTSGSAWAEEVAYKIAYFGADYNSGPISSYVDTWSATNDGFTVNLTNFNNNSNKWDLVKCGRKNNASIGTITTDAAIDKAISQVIVTVDAVTASNVNSFKLYVASDKEFNTVLETIAIDIAKGENIFTVTTPTENCYYKIEADCASGSSNGLVSISKIAFFYTVVNAVETPTFSVKEGGYTSAQSVEITCETEGATIYYTTDGTEPTNTSTVYTSAIEISSTTTLKAIAYKDSEASNVASATYTIVNLGHEGTEADPYTVADARTAIDANAGISHVYVQGIISQIDSFNETYGSITYWISADGTTTSDQLEVYGGLGLEAAKFSSITDLHVGDQVVVYGDLKKYKEIYEFDTNSKLVSHVRTEPTISVSSLLITLVSAEANYAIPVTYDNFPKNSTFNVTFFEADGSSTTTYDWIEAVIDDEGNLALSVKTNDTGAQRTAYLKVYGFDDDANDIYSDLVTIVQDREHVDYVTLPFSFDGGKSDISDIDGFSQNGLGNDYSASPKLKFDSTDDCLDIHFTEAAYALYFDIKGNSFSGGTFKVQTSADGTTYTDLDVYTELGAVASQIYYLDSDVRYIKWVYTAKVKGNVALGNIKVTTGPQELTKIVSPSKYATFCAPFATTIPSDIDAYTATLNDEGTCVTLTKIEGGVIPANTGVVLYADIESAKRFFFNETSTAASDDFSSNILVGVNEKTAYDKVSGYKKANKYYALQEFGEEVKFCLVTGGSYAANTAVIVANSSSQTIGLRFGDATQINTLETVPANAVIYDLTGRRVEKMTRGIYIVNGKKVMMK